MSATLQFFLDEDMESNGIELKKLSDCSGGLIFFDSLKIGDKLEAIREISKLISRVYTNNLSVSEVIGPLNELTEKCSKDTLILLVEDENFVENVTSLILNFTEEKRWTDHSDWHELILFFLSLLQGCTIKSVIKVKSTFRNCAMTPLTSYFRL